MMDLQKVLVIHPGSHTLKFGFASQIEPFEVPNVISYRGNPILPKPEIPSKVSDCEIIFQRRKFLEERKLIKPLPSKFDVGVMEVKSFMENDEDVYFESILIRESKSIPFPNSKNFGNNTEFIVGDCSDVFSETYYPFTQGFLNFELYKNSAERLKDDIYRIWNYCFKNYLNLFPSPESKSNEMKDKEEDNNNEEEEFDEKSKHYLSEYGVCLIISDNLRKEELQILLDVIFFQFGFPKCFVHRESVCATFNVGLAGVAGGSCVVDFGHSKTSIVCISKGLMHQESRICLPFGSLDVAKCLVSVLHQCEFPLGSEFKISSKQDKNKETIEKFDGNGDYYNITHNFRNFQIFNKLKERYCHFPDSSGKKELFQYCELVLDNFRNMTRNLFKFHLGDHVVIPGIGYFAPNLFFPFRFSSKFSLGSKVIRNSDIYEKEYVLFLKSYMGENYDSFVEYLKDQEEDNLESKKTGEEGEKDGNGDKIMKEKESSKEKKKKKKTGKSRDERMKRRNLKKRSLKLEVERLRKLYETNQVILPLNEALIQSLENSNLELNKKRKRKKGLAEININLIVVGGGANLIGLVDRLRDLVQKYFLTKFEEKENEKSKKKSNGVRVHIFPPLENKSENRAFVCWKGGALTPTFKSIRKLWIDMDEYKKFGMKTAKNYLPFVI